MISFTEVFTPFIKIKIYFESLFLHTCFRESYEKLFPLKRTELTV